MTNIYAPIVMFAYRRIPQKTIESLLENKYAKDSYLYIYSDGFKNDIDKQDVLKVRQYLKTIKGFKSISIKEAPTNKGLADSIINGVSEIINKYEKVIVLEDDLIVSNNFLAYMNEALDFYQNDKKIWSISGYGPKLPCLEKYEKDVYLSPRASSWGWASWKDRWNSVDWDVKEFQKLKKNKQMRKQFELGGDDLYKMLELQVLGKIDSWAIRWCYSQFLQKMYTVYPVKSKVLNVGFENMQSTHTSGSGKKWDVTLNSDKLKLKKLEPDENIIKNFKEFYSLSFFTEMGYFLRKHGGYNLAKRTCRLIREFFED